MHRAFRPPRVFPLPGVATTRPRLASTVAQESQRDRTASNHVKFTTKQTPPRLSPEKQVELAMKLECRPHLRGKRQQKVNGCRDLVDVREVMDIYRRHRDNPELSEPVPASDAVHLILTTVRNRMVTLRSVISSVRSEIIARQNEELKVYLEEIAHDVYTSRAYVSAFALTYLFTALSTMGQHREATQVWKLLNDPQCPHPPEIVNDPRVVGAALVAADPATISLSDVEQAYEDTVSRHSRHVLLDDSLARSYLRFQEDAKAARLYMDMCEQYDVSKWEDTLLRLHNQILTEAKDMSIADAFFVGATDPQSFVTLHPGAAAPYVRHKYEQTLEVGPVLDVYRRSVERLGTQPSRPCEPRHYQNLTTEVAKILMTAFPHDCPEGRRAILDFTEINSDILLLNTILSLVAKQWPESLFLLELQQLLLGNEQALSRIDSLRILMNSSSHVAVPAAQVADWWAQRKQIPVPLETFDWLALAKASDHPDLGRTTVFLDAMAHDIPAGTLPRRVMSRLAMHPHLAQALHDAGVKLPAMTTGFEPLTEESINISLQAAELAEAKTLPVDA